MGEDFIPELSRSAPRFPGQAQTRKKPRTISDTIVSYEYKENEYEKERRERIKRNMEIMRSLGLQGMADTVLQSASRRPESKVQKKNIQYNNSRAKEETTGREKYTRRTRSSARLLTTSDPGLASALHDKNAPTIGEITEEDRLLELEEYFALHSIDISNAIRSDGHFRGWVSSKVAQEYGIPIEQVQASDKDNSPIYGTLKSVSLSKAAYRARGWSGAKAHAATQLQKNPNAYFYRHVAPDEQQAQGEWSAEEHELFLKVARQWGSGDRWGLFASHIPQRVGYQCSAYYREVLIPNGYIIDLQFKMQRSGKAVYVGNTDR